MSRCRWWQSGERSVEVEAAWFAEDGLDFRLDEDLFNEHEVVVFRGELRLGDRTTPAAVHYPPGYGAGAHPTVFAPKLRLGRHQSPEGALCLDHPVFGEISPMYGGEAVLRAERLWSLWENDADQLADEEADAPDPRTNYYAFTPESAVTLVDVDVTGFSKGDLLLGTLQIAPFRAAVSRVRTHKPTETTVLLATSAQPFGGPHEMPGVWRRVDTPPPERLPQFVAWAKAHFGGLIDQQAKVAKAFAEAYRQPQKPTVTAFVYPDEGPKRGEIHDAWLFYVIAPDGRSVQLVRGFHLRSEERWLRQPQLRPLETKRAGVVGVGALGSPIADQLAKAGLGGLYLVDHDIVTPGNRVRHQLDVTDVGRAKVTGVANRVLRVNPWCKIGGKTLRLGSAVYIEDETCTQSLDDEVVGELGDCQLIVNASAHTVTGYYCSQVAYEVGRPVLHVWVSAGAWGARILLQRPGHSGCTECLALAQKRPPDGVQVPPVSDDPGVQEVMEQGCADPTFTGPGFELIAAASAATRVAVQSLLADDGGYPPADFDLVTLKFRDATSATPTATYTRLPVHPECTICNAASGG